MEEFRVSVESLHTTRVKEINYEGEEVYQEKPSLSQKLSELAHRVDFEEVEENDTNEGTLGLPSKKPSRRWPWEFTHSKLKHALTEVSVLSDILHILSSHRQYISLDPVYSSKRSILPFPYQYNIKKKALGIAATILRKGVEPLMRTSSQGDQEFHRALHDLGKRWRLRRTSVGVSGDLSYHSAGSLYTQSVQFEIHKGNKESGDILSVIVPQELRGHSEVVIFLSNVPIKEVGALDPLLPSCFIELQKKRLLLTSWEQKLLSAQNVLFNEELFAQLAKEAFDQKSDLQGEVLTDRINIPLNTGSWLSVLLVREYEGQQEIKESPIDLPQPSWELTVAFKQLLRANHQYVTAPRPPRPSNASSNTIPELREAGASAFSTTELKQLEYDFSIYNKLVKMARHLDSEKKVKEWLYELCQMSSDPCLVLVFTPSLSLTSSSFSLAFTSPDIAYRWKTVITLTDSIITFKQPSDNQLISIPVDKQYLIRILKRQAVLFMMNILEKTAQDNQWLILQHSTLPQPSLTVLKSGAHISMSCRILLESANGTRRLELLVEYGHVTANISHVIHTVDVTTGLDTEGHVTGGDNRVINLVPTINTSLIAQVITLMEHDNY